MSDITSPTNPIAKSIVRLRQRRTRDATNTFLIEGAVELARASANGRIAIETVLVSETQTYEPVGAERVLTVADAVLEKVAVRGVDAGLVAIAHQFDVSLAAFPVGLDLVLVAEGIEKPGNLGAMLRVADAAGAGVIVCDPLVDVFNPHVVRASLGCLFSVPLAQAQINECIEYLTHYDTVVATPEASEPLYDIDLTGPTAIVIGSEHDGVSGTWKQAATAQCSIPMAGQADSLNAATSAAVMLFEALRQRR